MSFKQVWSDSAIVPTASLIAWRQYGTFNDSRNLTREMLLKVNCFAPDKGKSLIYRIFTKA